jgi:glutathione S-transferase
MILVFNPDDSYIHKVLVVAHEAGVLDRLQLRALDPFGADTDVWKYSALGKAPMLILDDGSPLYGGLIVCEYLDSLSPGRRLFPQDASRWRALRLMVLGDAMFDATALMRVEGQRPRAEWHLDYLARERRKVVGALDEMEREAPVFAKEPFHIGHVCMAGGISYVATRNPIKDLKIAPGDETFEWRANLPALAAWYDAITMRPSLAFKLGRCANILST